MLIMKKFIFNTVIPDSDPVSPDSTEEGESCMNAPNPLVKRGISPI